MRKLFVAVTALSLLGSVASAEAGCVTGAIVGGIAGHLAGHGVAGAAGQARATPRRRMPSGSGT